MQILMASTSYPADEQDWKGLFIRRLAEALARRDDIELRLWAPPGVLPANAVLDLTDIERRWLAQLMARGGIAHLMRSRSPAGMLAPLRLLNYLRKAFRRNAHVSLYHVNWLQNALVLPNPGRPALLTALGTDMQLLRLPGMKAMLRRKLSTRPAAICPNADWMVQPLKKAFGDVAHVECVPFGIDPRWYQLTRQWDGTRPTRWLVVSRLTAAKLGPLFEWCRPLFEAGNRELHLFGPMQETIEVPDWIHYHGSTTPDDLCRDWFPDACGLITLSRHNEGRPQVMLEAMASGLPIIASQLVAHRDLLHHGKTGWICDDQQAFAMAISALESQEMNASIGTAARLWAAEHIGTWDDCAARYVALYTRLLATRHA